MCVIQSIRHHWRRCTSLDLLIRPYLMRRLWPLRMVGLRIEIFPDACLTTAPLTTDVRTRVVFGARGVRGFALGRRGMVLPLSRPAYGARVRKYTSGQRIPAVASIRVGRARTMFEGFRNGLPVPFLESAAIDSSHRFRH